MGSHKSACVFLLSITTVISGQYLTYPRYNQGGFPNVPTEIIDLPSGIEQQARFPINNVPFQQQFKPNNRGFYPYPYNIGGYYPTRQQYPTVQLPTSQNLQGLKQLPKYIFKNPTPEFPNGYYVIPGSQRQVEMPQDKIKVTEVSTTSNDTVQEFPGYVIKQTSQRFQTPNQNPIKITTNTVEYKPFHTVLTRYIDKNGKAIIKLENENGTLTLNDKGSTNLSVNNGKLEINGVDPLQLTTTEAPESEAEVEENVTPNDVSSWLG